MPLPLAGSPDLKAGRPPRAAAHPVWLVGAGPGDADLLTRQAERLLRQASIVFHDALVGPGVLALIPPGVRRVSVGKRAGAYSAAQSGINRMLVEAALCGHHVVRLKGGDPSVFGRSGEEIAVLAAHGLPVRICPGVTSACAAAAAAGLSLTLREQARNVTFVTARTCSSASAKPDHDWPALAAGDGSLVVYMGRSNAGQVARSLMAAGRAGETPVLVAANVSLPDEMLLHTRLDALAVSMLALPACAAATLLIGDAFATTHSSRGAVVAVVDA